MKARMLLLFFSSYFFAIIIIIMIEFVAILNQYECSILHLLAGIAVCFLLRLANCY